MQAFIRRFFCGFCAFAVVILFCVPQTVYAVEDDMDIWDGTSVTNFGDAFLILRNLVEWGAYMQLANFSDAFQGVSGSDQVILLNSPFYCEKADSATDGAQKGHLFDDASPSIRYCFCKYCGISGADWLALMEDAEDDYVASLSPSTALIFHCYRGYGYAAGVQSAMQYGSYSAFCHTASFAGSFDGLNLVLSNASSGGYEIRFSSDPLSLPEGYYTVPSVTVDLRYPMVGVLGQQPFAVHVVRYDPSSDGFTVLNTQYAPQPSTNYMESVEYITSPMTFYATQDYLYFVLWGFSSAVAYLDVPSGLTFSSPLSLTSFDSSGTVYDPTDEEQSADEKYDESTRVAFLMDLLAQYNKANSYLENSDAVNYFMGTVDEDGNITGVYGLPEFDEETMVFTEPVTGAQYQCTGWTYDYNTRCYDITLEPGTFTLGGSDVAQILCTYGDEYVVIEYYDENGLLLDAQQFVYAMVASNSCALEGHSYSITSTKAATCTSVGERVYTCSVCGGQKVETIPMNEHAHVYSEIKQPTCTDPGYGAFTCSTCGGQYTETLDPLGHDWLSTETVETVYSLPPGTACPDCSGTEFTWELDELNALYTCTCGSCEVSWQVNADVDLGYTTYKCSRCDETKVEQDGEAGDGLFKSIGNFFADGINWCTEKLTQLVDSLTDIVDTFNDYLDQLPKPGTYPKFLSMFLESLPQELTAVIWFAVIAFVILCVFKIFFR